MNRQVERGLLTAVTTLSLLAGSGAGPKESSTENTIDFQVLMAESAFTLPLMTGVAPESLLRAIKAAVKTNPSSEVLNTMRRASTLLRRNGGSAGMAYYCNGTSISNNIVLFAAHCAPEESSNLIAVFPNSLSEIVVSDSTLLDENTALLKLPETRLDEHEFTPYLDLKSLPIGAPMNFLAQKVFEDEMVSELTTTGVYLGGIQGLKIAGTQGFDLGDEGNVDMNRMGLILLPPNIDGELLESTSGASFFSSDGRIVAVHQANVGEINLTILGTEIRGIMALASSIPPIYGPY